MSDINYSCKNKCGIYCIFNVINGKRYVGSSVDLYNRLHEHLHNLKNDKGHNKHLQNSWNKHGEENFNFNILEYCDKNDLLEREQYYIDFIKPEFNFSLNVIGNLNRVISDDIKSKISNTLKEKYASGEIKTYRQDHAQIKTYIYNVETIELVNSFNCKKEASDFLGYPKVPGNFDGTGLLKEKYCITFEPIEDKLKLLNHISKNIMTYTGNQTNYIIVMDNDGNMKYYKNLVSCALENNSSRSTLSKHMDASIENPYILKNNKKFITSQEYISIEKLPYN